MSFRALAAIPVELLVFVALSLVLPRRLGRLLAALCGVTLAATFLVTLLDLAFFEAFDRPFDLISDPGYVELGARPAGVRARRPRTRPRSWP